MRKYILILSLLIIPFSIIIAEDNPDRMRAANWVFGERAWVDFSDGAPKCNNGARLSTTEGVASMSDTDGNLLFYTDGRNVWNREHEQMQNGNGLLGDESSTQSAVIFPVPEDDNKYYIATVDEIWQQGWLNPSENPNHAGLNYSVVDMSKDGGLGAVLNNEKNIKLSNKVCEKLTAVGHANGEDYWLVTQVWRRNVLQVFLVNKNGISLSEEYPMTIFKDFKNSAHTKGCIKFSADATMLASANNGVGLFLYDFDNSNGEISNERGWRDNEFRNSYGVEFSLTGRFLYVTSAAFGDNGGYNNMAYVFQIDLSSNDIATIENSLVELDRRSNTSYPGDNGTQSMYGSVQLAIDEKIYVCRRFEQYLAVINDIEEKGTACNYVKNGFRVTGNTYNVGPTLGLPQMIQSYYFSTPNIDVVYDKCSGGSIILNAEYKEGYTYNWSGPLDFSVDTCYWEIFPSKEEHTGEYILTIIYPNGYEKVKKYNVVIKHFEADIDFIVPNKTSGPVYKKSEEYYFTITNKTKYELVIKDAQLMYNDKFKLNPVNFPIQLEPYGTSANDISCYVESDEWGEFNDSLIVTISEPCDFISSHGMSYEFDPIILYVKLPKDTVVDINNIIRLPLRAKLSDMLPEGTKLDADITWHYLEDVFYAFPNQMIDCTISNVDSIDSDNEYVLCKFNQLELDTIYKTIGYINGYPLLDEKTSTPLAFDTDTANSWVSLGAVQIVGEDGRLSILKPECLSPDIQMNPDITHAALPSKMPISNEGRLFLYSPDHGQLELEIYSVSGEKIESFSFANNAIFYKELPLNLNKYNNGTYLLVWKSSKRTFRKSIIISK